MKFSTIPARSARPRRTRNPWIAGRSQQRHPDAKVRPIGKCVYCRKQRATTKDHVLPRSVLRAYNRLAPDDAPSVPAQWLGVEFSCHDCNVTKGSRRLLPESWRNEVAAMNRFFGGVPFRVWHGGTTEPAYRETHLGPAAVMVTAHQPEPTGVD